MLHGGCAHLFPATAPRGGLGLRLLAVMLPETRVHIGFNRGGVFQNVGQHALLNRPAEEIQLAHGGLLNRGRTDRLKADPVATAEWIKQPLGIGLEFALVLKMDDELLAVQRITDIELLGVVCCEPFYYAEADGGGAVQKGQNLLNAAGRIVKLLEPSHDQLLFALNAVLLGGTVGVHRCFRDVIFWRFRYRVVLCLPEVEYGGEDQICQQQC